ncbi:MAG: Rrf2 family transcriptional regulator [Candidatus Margulisiibacteriota bacterium]|nr:Rrf2 family transcriptional regulator [Candidatus Margulisiibacteriota bacterium]
MAIDPKKINLAEVIEAIEGPLVISDCIFNKRSCLFSGKCKARKCFSMVQSKMHEMLHKTYISDLALHYR